MFMIIKWNTLRHSVTPSAFGMYNYKENMSAPKYCAQPFAYTPSPQLSPWDYRLQGSVPGCTYVDAVMNLTNASMVPFDNYGYREARTACRAKYDPFRETLDVSPLPQWPHRHSKLYPTRDFTVDSYSVMPADPQHDPNRYHNFVAAWNPKIVPFTRSSSGYP